MSQYVLLFYTHGGAIRISRDLKAQGVQHELAPVPRELSSSCGVAGFVELDDDHSSLIDDEHVERIYVMTEEGYDLVHRAEGS